MAIGFNEVPSTVLVPWAYIEFNSSEAVTGGVQKYKTLFVGQKNPDGIKQAFDKVRVSSADEAGKYFGRGSVLHKMVEAYRNNNNFGELHCVALDDLEAGIKAKGSIELSGENIARGLINLYIAGELVVISVNPEGQDSALDNIAKDIVDQINSEKYSHLLVEAKKHENKVNLTAKNKGTIGNDIDIRVNYYDGDKLPENLKINIEPMSGGDGNPDISLVLTEMADAQYNIVGLPYSDRKTILNITDELERRWGPRFQTEGVCVCALRGEQGDLAEEGKKYNSQLLTIEAMGKSPSPIYSWIGAKCGVISKYGETDPARPFQTLELKGILPAKSTDQFTMEERNALLYDGISTNFVDAGGKVRIEAVVTTYKKNPLGAEDTSYRYLNTVLTLSFLRFDQRNYLLRKYPRHKLADDGTQFDSGQKIVTPKILKAELIGKFREWERKGLVENIDHFVESLTVERNIDNPNRLDYLMKPNLINQLRVFGAQISFIA